LRNSVAHFKLLPLDKDGRFSGIRIWNGRDSDKQITFVADIDFERVAIIGALRPWRTPKGAGRSSAGGSGKSNDRGRVPA